MCMYYALIPPSSLSFVFLQESGTEAHQDGMCITPNALVKERSQNKQLSMFTRWTNLFLLAELLGNEHRPTSILPQVALLCSSVICKGFTVDVGRFIIKYQILKHLESQNGHLEFHPSESIPASLWTQFLSFGRVIFWQLLSQQNARRRCQNKWLLTLAPVFCIFWSVFQFSTLQSISSMGIFYSKDVQIIYTFCNMFRSSVNIKIEVDLTEFPEFSSSNSCK